MSTYILQPIGPGPAVVPLDDVQVAGNTIRAVSSSTPSTTGWNVGDVWVDTLNSVTTNVVRVWTGTAFAPARSVAAPLLTEMFTGTDGTAWSSSNWALGTNPSAGTGGGATIQGNQGRLTTSNIGGYAGSAKIGRKANLATQADVNITFSFTYDATECLGACWIRADSTISQAAGYAVVVGPGTWQVSKVVAAVQTGLSSVTSFAYSTGTQYSARFYVVGTAVKFRIWVAASAEPSTWNYQTTDSTITAAGYTGFSLSGGNAASSSNFFLDNVTIESS